MWYQLIICQVTAMLASPACVLQFLPHWVHFASKSKKIVNTLRRQNSGWLASPVLNHSASGEYRGLSSQRFRIRPDCLQDPGRQGAHETPGTLLMKTPRHHPSHGYGQQVTRVALRGPPNLDYP